MNALKNFFSAKRVAIIGVFVALSYAVSFLEIPMPFFGASFLKLDFGNVFITLIAFLLGPIEGVLVCLMKEGLRCLTSTSLCAGELANFITTSVFILLPSILYKFKRNLKTVVITLSISCVIATSTALLVNRFISFPVFAHIFGGNIYGMTVTQAFNAFYPAIILFNAIKTLAVSLLTMALYKRLSNFIKSFEGKSASQNITNERISNSFKQTVKIGKEYAKTLKPGSIVLLKGDLGAGKTAFTKGIALGLGVKEEILSPTYAYMNDYSGVLYHYDCYRLSSGEEAEALGLTDYFYGQGVCVIEWAENIKDVIPNTAVTVSIEKLKGNKRKIIL